MNACKKVRMNVWEPKRKENMEQNETNKVLATNTREK